MHELITKVVDNRIFFEVQPAYAPNILIGFARLGGRSVGIVANQPAFLAGVLDINSSVKAARFVRFCDAFNIPLITFVDVPGFLPGTIQESGGIIRHGAKLLYAFAEATVPKVYHDYPQSLRWGIRCDEQQTYWRRCQLCIPLCRDCSDGRRWRRKDYQQRKSLDVEQRAAAVENYRETFSNPYKAAELGYIDEVIYPRQTRSKLIQALEMTQNKHKTNPLKKHGNIPL